MNSTSTNSAQNQHTEDPSNLRENIESKYSTCLQIISILDTYDSQELSNNGGHDDINQLISEVAIEERKKVSKTVTHILTDRAEATKLYLLGKHQISKLIFGFLPDGDFSIELGKYSFDCIFYNQNDFKNALQDLNKDLRGFSDIRNNQIVSVAKGYGESDKSVIGILQHESQHAKYYYINGNQIGYKHPDTITLESIYEAIEYSIEVSLFKMKDEVIAREIYGGHTRMIENFSTVNGSYFYSQKVLEYLLKHSSENLKLIANDIFTNYLCSELKRVSENVIDIVKDNPDILNLLTLTPLEEWYAFSKLEKLNKSDFTIEFSKKMIKSKA